MALAGKWSKKVAKQDLTPKSAKKGRLIVGEPGEKSTMTLLMKNPKSFKDKTTGKDWTSWRDVGMIILTNTGRVDDKGNPEVLVSVDLFHLKENYRAFANNKTEFTFQGPEPAKQNSATEEILGLKDEDPDSLAF